MERLSPPSGNDKYYTNSRSEISRLLEPSKGCATVNSAGETHLLWIKSALLLWAEFAELSFLSPSSPNTVPENPQHLCTPQLLQLLTPIFSPVTPPPSSPSSESDAEPVDESLHCLKPLRMTRRFLTCPAVCSPVPKTLGRVDGHQQSGKVFHILVRGRSGKGRKTQGTCYC